MRIALRAVLLVALLSLAGCGGETGSLMDNVKAVQAATTKACSYLPTVASVSAMLTANNPTVIGVSAIAGAICNAVTKPPNVLGLKAEECPEVNGVCVEGDFVDPDDEE